MEPEGEDQQRARLAAAQGLALGAWMMHAAMVQVTVTKVTAAMGASVHAAIALPAFLGQQSKGQDASAKSDTRNLVSQLESCFANEQTYVGCMGTGDTVDGSASGLPIGGSKGQVTASGLATDGYTVIETAKSGDVFSIVKAANGAATRGCTPAGSGSCPTGGSW